MKQLYQIAADALIAEMKRLNPNILSVSDYSYRFWYTLEIDGKVTVFDDLGKFLMDLPKLIYPKFDIQLSVFPAVQHFAIFICGAVYYKLFSILIFLNGIFLYFSRS